MKGVASFGLLAAAAGIASAQEGQSFIVPFVPLVGTITNFQASVVIPPVSPNAGTGERIIWAGVQNEADNVYFENVLDDFTHPGYWTFSTQLGTGINQIYNQDPVVSGDTLTTTLTMLSENPNTWSEANTFTADGNNAGNGNVASVTFNSDGLTTNYINAFLEIVVNAEAEWDFGPVTFSDISITAITEDTTWCISPDVQTVPPTDGVFHYTMTPAVVTTSGGNVTCNISQFVFQSPP